MFKPGDIISYLDMCKEEGVNLQRGMNFKLRGKYSIILMSVRKGSPYNDEIKANGKTLIYEGHDQPLKKGSGDPKKHDQPMVTPNGTLTQNGLFFNAAASFKDGKSLPELVKVYEKINPGIWVYNGFFKLVDAWLENVGIREVFKFKLEIVENMEEKEGTEVFESLEHTRMIPSFVKLEVWKRDGGKCVKCGEKDNLHYDHIIPFSKGGSSLTAKNIQLLCARHNISKRDKIE